MFKVGDKVRIKDQGHDFCGFYGEVVNLVGNDGLVITCDDYEEPVTRMARQDQVEAN